MWNSNLKNQFELFIYETMQVANKDCSDKRGTKFLFYKTFIHFVNTKSPKCQRLAIDSASGLFDLLLLVICIICSEKFSILIQMYVCFMLKHLVVSCFAARSNGAAGHSLPCTRQHFQQRDNKHA